MAEELTNYGNDRSQAWDNVIAEWVPRLDQRAQDALSFWDRNSLVTLIIDHMERVREFGFDDRQATPQGPPRPGGLDAD